MAQLMDDKDRDKRAVQAASAPPLPKMKRGVRGFYKDCLLEMKKVHWPTRQETNRQTGIVIAVCLMTVAILTALSYAFDTIFRILLRGGF